MSLNLSVFDEFPTLQTTRLQLRDIQLEDAEAIFAMRSNGRVNQFIARPQMQQLEDAQALVARTQRAFADRLAIGWAGILRQGSTIIGSCGFNSIEPQNHHAEIGGEMATEYWGKGIAQEAVKAILQFGLDTLGLHTIEAKVNPGNRGAIYVMESLGFQKEAHYRDRIRFQDQFWDMAVYTLIKGNAPWE
jgi:ribosomal-protein-alanine N-acetyltransferase